MQVTSTPDNPLCMKVFSSSYIEAAVDEYTYFIKSAHIEIYKMSHEISANSGSFTVVLYYKELTNKQQGEV